jgi:hypothetical protein
MYVPITVQIDRAHSEGNYRLYTINFIGRDSARRSWPHYDEALRVGGPAGLLALFGPHRG